MKRDSISKEVLKHIESTTGYINIAEKETLDSVNFDRSDVNMMSIKIFKSLQLGEDNADELIENGLEEITDDSTIGDYVDAVYNFIHK